MRLRPLLTLALCAALAGPAVGQVMRAGSVAPVDGQHDGPVPNRLAGQIGVSERLGERVPTDLAFLDEEGRRVQLASLVDGERPTVVAFVYHSCPMLCSLILDSVAEAVAESDHTAGEDYQVLAVSMDPRDTPARADSAKARYVALSGADPSALHFWTTGDDLAASTEALGEATGFGYAYDARTGEYAHSAALVLLSPEGTITRYLYGLNYAGRDFDLGVVEASEGTVGSALDKFLLTCYVYDEDAQAYSLQVLTVTKIGGGLLLFVFGGFLVYLWRRETRRPPDGWADARRAGGPRPATA